MHCASLGRGFEPKAFYTCIPFVSGTMSILDVFRQEYVQGKVMDKYRLENGNLGLIVEDAVTRRRYHVEFRDGYKGPSAENFFGLLKEPFAGKTECLGSLIREGDNIDLTLSYSRGPFREAYYVHSVSRLEPKRGYSQRPLSGLFYQYGTRGGY